MVTLHAFVKPSANALRQHAVGGIVRETAMIVQNFYGKVTVVSFDMVDDDVDNHYRLFICKVVK